MLILSAWRTVSPQCATRMPPASLLASFAEHDELGVVRVKSLWNLPQQRVAQYLADLLKACALCANRRSETAPRPVRIATWADCRICLGSAFRSWRVIGVHARHVIHVPVAPV